MIWELRGRKDDDQARRSVDCCGKFRRNLIDGLIDFRQIADGRGELHPHRAFGHPTSATAAQ